MKAHLIIDLAFGSTGKGQFAGWYAHGWTPDAAVCAFGPNAGHTFWTDDGQKFVHTMLPTSALVPSVRRVFLGPGAVLDVEAVQREWAAVRTYRAARGWEPASLIIHSHAVLVTDEHRHDDRRHLSIGSTQKGTGAAAIARMQRDPDDAILARFIGQPGKNHKVLQSEAAMSLLFDVVSAPAYERALNRVDRLLVEGAQGYSLSLYHGFWPYVTYRDVTPAQVLADCGVPVQCLQSTLGVTRTLPIRVANRYDETGQMVGYSGPFYPDQREMEWREIGVEPELTTVTKLPRRIATYSHQQMERAVWQCRPDAVYLNFANYLPFEQVKAIIVHLESLGTQVRWVGAGPKWHQLLNIHDYVAKEGRP